jgi:transposase
MNYKFIGIDVSKDKFDVAIKKGDSYKNMVFSRNETGLKKFVSYLEQNVENPWC